MKRIKTFKVTCGAVASEFMLGRISGMLSTINVNDYEFIMRKQEDGTWDLTVEATENACWLMQKHIEEHYPGLCKFAFVDRK